MPTLTKEIIEAAIFGFEVQMKTLDDRIAELRVLLPGASAKSGTPTRTRRPRRKMSAAGRRAIAEAQRKRWAAAKAAPAEKTATKKAKRKLSAAGRAAIAAAQKKRWAEKRAAG